jgi:hypothetical protein
MQIKTEKDKIPLKRTVFSFLLLMLIYGALAFGLSLWMYGESWSEAGLVRWINLLLVPLAGTLLLVRSARSARIYFTHLTQKDMIQQRLTDSLIRDGYRISESLPHQVYFRSEFPLLSSISGRAPLWMEFEEDYILLHGPWNKIHELERQAHEGEIFLPKSR